MPSAIHLRADVHTAAIGDDLVLLDAAADRYLCAPGAAALLSAGPFGRPEPASEEAASALLEAGLAAVGPPPAVAAVLPPLPTRALDRDAPKLVRGDAVRLLACFVDFHLYYRGRRFDEILGFVRRGRARAALSRDCEAVAAAAGRFEAAAIWLPVPGKCLARSFLLMRFLHRSGLDADWVIAVRTWPFGAHCWLQLGDLALEEPPERLVAYCPICVV